MGFLLFSSGFQLLSPLSIPLILEMKEAFGSRRFPVQPFLLHRDRHPRSGGFEPVQTKNEDKNHVNRVTAVVHKQAT